MLRSGAYEGGRVLYADPLVQVFEGFLGAGEAEALMSAAWPQLKRAEVSGGSAGKLSEGRTGSNCWVPHAQSPEIAGLAERLAALVRLPLRQAESFQVVHYGEEEEYRPHYDAWDADTERGQRCMARGGQRLVTCLCYLNEVAAGGGTIFPKLDLEVQARPGRLLVFHNCLAGTSQRHPLSLHGGLPVLAGEKWACNLWFRERDYYTAR